MQTGKMASVASSHDDTLTLSKLTEVPQDSHKRDSWRTKSYALTFRTKSLIWAKNEKETLIDLTSRIYVIVLSLQYQTLYCFVCLLGRYVGISLLACSHTTLRKAEIV